MFARHAHLLRLALIYVFVCFFSLAVSPIHVFASANVHIAADPITVDSQQSNVSFPKSIDFQINAHDSASTITSATLYIMYNAEGYQEQHQVNAKPAPSVTLKWHEDTNGDNFNPPGTKVTYYWLIMDTAGNSHKSVPQSLQVTDTRFNWQHLNSGLLQVNWYGRSTTFGQILLNQVNISLKRISGNLGGNVQHTINLWVYTTKEDFHSALPPQTSEWVGGIAFPRLNQASIVVDGPADDTLQRDMPHELTHLLFHQLTAQGITAPIWFDEGLAVYNQAYQEPAMKLRFKIALNSHSLLRLSEITFHFPNDADKAYLAYAQSWQLVNYMYSTFGQAKMARFVHAMNNSQASFSDDLTQVLGTDTDHLENNWRLSLNQSPTLAPGNGTSPSQTNKNVTPAANTVDANTMPLVLLGILLVLLPALGIAGLFAYQRRGQQRTLAVQQAQQIINATQSPYLYGQAPFMPTVPNTDASNYPTARPSYQPFATPWPNQPPPATPFPGTYHAGNQPAPGQEYINWRYPNRQAPQE